MSIDHATLSSLSTLPALLDAVAAETPNAPAIVAADGTTLTHGDLAAWRQAFRADLRRLGIGQGDRVVAPLPNGPAGACLAVGLVCAATLAPITPDLPAEEVAALLRRFRPAALVLLPGAFDAARAAAAEVGVPILAAVPSGPLTIRLEGDPVGPAAANRAATPDDIAAIVGTSGSTGRAKLVMNSHRNLASLGEVGLTFLGLRPGDRTILLPPLAYGFGLGAVLRSLLIGGSIVCPERTDPPSVAAMMARHDPNWLTLPTPLLAALLPILADRQDLPNPRLRVVRAGGAAIPDEVRQVAERRLGMPVHNSLGSTEAQGIAAEGPDFPRRAGTAGAVVGRLRIVGEDGTLLPEGEPGEIQASGDTVFPGYWDDPDLTARAFTSDGWFRSGDRGLIRDGYLTLLGRADEMVNRGGQKVDPLEVEQALTTHPAVAEAAVFGIPDPRLGREVAAAVVLRPGAALGDREARRWLLDRLAPHKVPRVIHFVDALPRTPAGKVARAALAETFGAHVPEPG